MTFDEARAQFPVLERLAYLNAGTFGPLAQSTADALELHRRRDLEQGRSGAFYWEGLMEAREELRARLAALLRAAPEQVALTGSTTDGCNVVLGGLGLGPDDEVVTTDVEHPGLLGPLEASGARIRV
ncbi:MAG TPA: aminotransferase class V-fold PLP-dependent enzyme, partial [Gaiellaceae bacterium]|nr:aminotransferase class V-fold PLP-dependent enzyme [Gaiellaceae bacterium]